MRLLNTTTLKLEEFWDSDAAPPYAILSHTWEKQEVSFRAIENLDSAVQLIGFSKIQACCRQALADGYEWVWIDTCCIDKSSSAELSEAINSMFHWYKESAICYAYLADVPSDDDPQAHGSAFSKSRWFTRGWTLQELISPRGLVFFSKDWMKLGDRQSLSTQVSENTRIDTEVLTGDEPVHSKSVAQRMSWASRRSTTRMEDMAYCLLGIFDVNMPLLYGEGKKAFLRLQEEILKSSTDHSLFAWTAKEYESFGDDHIVLGGLLATSPADFENSNIYVPAFSSRRTRAPYSMTNRGLCIDLPLFQVEHEEMKWLKEGWIAILECRSTLDKDKDWGKFIGIYLVMDTSPDTGLKRTERHYQTSQIGVRDCKISPISVRMKNPCSNGSKNWVKVEWNLANRDIDAGWCTLYVPQKDILSSTSPFFGQRTIILRR
jgi:hypothetical protein